MSHGWNETMKTIEDQILFKASNARLPSLFGVVIYGLITGTLSNPPPVLSDKLYRGNLAEAWPSPSQMKAIRPRLCLNAVGLGRQMVHR